MNVRNWIRRLRSKDPVPEQAWKTLGEDVGKPYVWKAIVKVIGPIIESRVTSILAGSLTRLAITGITVTTISAGVASGGDALNVWNLPFTPVEIEQPLQSGVWFADEEGLKYVSEPAAGLNDNSLTLVIGTDFSKINIIDVAAGTTGISRSLSFVSGTPGQQFFCDTLTLDGISAPKLNMFGAFHELEWTDNESSGNDHNIVLVDLGPKPSMAPTPRGLGEVHILGGSYDKVEIVVLPDVRVGQIFIQNFGVTASGEVYVSPDIECGRSVITNSRFGSGTGINTQEFVADILLDDSDISTLTNNREIDIDVK